ncbi:hypothetical protein EYB35_02435 [Bacillus paranthracis]|nr:hypothetical protein BCPR1_01990 [Bacillus paranthracis]TBL18957.1 hypothetical protein EYB35_02435 [Bacillus paranthracis]
MLFSARIPHLVSTEIYRRFFKYIDRNSNYIGDYFNISTFRHNLSTYRQFSTRTYIPHTPTNKPQTTKKLSHIRDSFLLYICS